MARRKNKRRKTDYEEKSTINLLPGIDFLTLNFQSALAQDDLTTKVQELARAVQF